MCSSVSLERYVVVPSRASVVANASLHARVALCQVCGASDVKRVHMHDCQSKHMHMLAMHVTQTAIHIGTQKRVPTGVWTRLSSV